MKIINNSHGIYYKTEGEGVNLINYSQGTMNSGSRNVPNKLPK